MVKAIARQLDRCEVCGKKLHRRDLVYTNVAFLAAGGSNYFDYSSYNSNFWLVDTSSVSDGCTSSGPYADRARVQISDDNTRTEILGSQTWTIGDAIGPYSGLTSLRSNSIDISSWSSFVVSFDFGYHDQDTSAKRVMVYCVLQDENANSNGIIKRFTGNYSSGRYWWAYNTADVLSTVDISTARFFLVFATYEGGEKIWIDRMQLEKNATKMGAFVPTSGSSIDRIDTPMMTVRKVCPQHRERLLSKTEQYGRRAEQRTDDPVSVDIQEA